MDFLRLLEAGRNALCNALLAPITAFGEETLFLVVSMIALWCVDKKKGYYLLFVGVLGNVVNQLLKLLFCVPRPWVRDPAFTIVERARAQATGYSFPSGHTQTATGLYGGIARVTKNGLLRGLCIAFVALVGFSRMYLGVHTPADVAVSLAIGAALVFAAWPMFCNYDEDAKPAFLALAVLFLVSLGVTLYAEFAPFPANAILEFSDDGVETAYKLLGTSAGLLLCERLDRRYLRYDVRAPLPLQFVKAALGIGILVAARLLLKAPLLVLFAGHNIAHTTRYFVMTLLGGFAYPATFRFWANVKTDKTVEPAA